MKYLLDQWVNASNPQRVELVFENKNKAYGAYKIRLEQAKYQFYALGITVSVALLLFGGSQLYYTFFKETIAPVDKIDIYVGPEIVLEDEVIPPVQETEQTKGSSGSSNSTATFQHVTPNIGGQNNGFDPSSIEGAGVPGLGNSRGNDGLFNGTGETAGGEGNNLFGRNEGHSHVVVNLPARFNHPSMDITEFIQSEFILPPTCPETMKMAAVNLSFVIGKNGQVKSVKVLDETKSCLDYTKEIIRILKMTRWSPASHNGNLIESHRTIPIALDVSNY